MIINILARLFVKKKYDYITPVLKELHWLPVQTHIDFKLCLMVFNWIQERAPPYLQELNTPYQPSRPLRSGIKERKRNQSAMRSFKYAAAHL